MFIQTESTPNPLTMKFLPGMPVLPEGTRFYTSAERAEDSPLARELFRVPGITAVFLGADFVTVTRAESAEWPLLKAEILTGLMDFFVAGLPVIQESQKQKPSPASVASAEEDSAIIQEIKELIETRVRPAVAMDGGDIVFHSYESGVVRLEMHGSCSGCPSSTQTLKHGIENMLKHYIPEVQAVEPV
jgi:Fe-S cluster biogenesis protein NfuA